MKEVISLCLISILLLTGCSSVDKYETYVDADTGVNYLVVSTVEGVSITPRLNDDGSLYVTKKVEPHEEVTEIEKETTDTPVNTPIINDYQWRTYTIDQEATDAVIINVDQKFDSDVLYIVFNIGGMHFFEYYDPDELSIDIFGDVHYNEFYYDDFDIDHKNKIYNGYCDTLGNKLYCTNSDCTSFRDYNNFSIYVTNVRNTNFDEQLRKGIPVRIK